MLPPLPIVLSQALVPLAYSFAAICINVLAYVVYELSLRILRLYRSPLRELSGPPSLSWVFGSVEGIIEADAERLFDQWAQQYGRTFKYSSFFNSNKLFTADLKAVQFVLNSPNFEKSDQLKFALGELLGNGILFVEGAKHQRQRKIMNPAFGFSELRKFTGTFVEKALELRDIWSTQVHKHARPDGKLQVDAFDWMNKVTLDMIGLAGFNYDFSSLHPSESETHELHDAVRKMFDIEAQTLTFLVQALFPPTRMFPTKRSRTTAHSLKVIRRIGTKMIAEKKAEVLAARSVVESKDIAGRDLLSLLIKSNMAMDLQESERMTDEEILSQVPAFLVAGHETTSSGITWALFALAAHPRVQAKLRSELSAVRTDRPSMDELNSLTYLDATIRETMRLHSPVPITERVATTDTVIPLDSPYVDKKGVKHTTVRLGARDTVLIPMRSINRSKELWGYDAEEFIPERWLETNNAVRAIPSVWSNITSFLAGPHACIGYRFAVLEMKALMFALVRTFEFEAAIQAEDVGRRCNIVGRPYLCSNPGAGPQLPLLIREVQER